MIIEKIIFNIIALAVFIVLFMKMIKKNDTIYVPILGLEFVGLVINFFELILSTTFAPFFRVIMYLLSIIIPFAVIILERTKKVDFSEIFYITMAKMYITVGKNEEAKEYALKLISKYPQSYQGHKILAEVYKKEGKNDNAIDEYRKVIEINKKDLMINYEIANLMNEEGKKIDAIGVLQDILKQKPDLYKATSLLGDILYETEQYKEAVNVYTNALMYHPGNYDLYYSLGMAYTMLNDFQKAKEFYDRAAEVNSLLYNAKLDLAQIAIIYGDLDEAERYLKESLKGEDAESGSYYYLAQVAILRGDTEKATNYLNLAIELNPKMYDRVQKENIFTPIKQNVKVPTDEERKNARKNKMSKKEKKAMNHLAKTCMLVSSLNNDDIKMMLNVKQKEKGVKQKQREN